MGRALDRLPPMIGLTATQAAAARGERVADARAPPRIVPIETIGLEGQMTIASAAAIASSRPGAGRASSMPSISMLSISSAAPCLTRYSWKVRTPAGVVIRRAHRVVAHREERWPRRRGGRRSRR